MVSEALDINKIRKDLHLSAPVHILPRSTHYSRLCNPTETGFQIYEVFSLVIDSVSIKVTAQTLYNNALALRAKQVACKNEKLTLGCQKCTRYVKANHGRIKSPFRKII